MNKQINCVYFILSFFVVVKCIPSPVITPMTKTEIEISKILINENNSPLFTRTLEEITSYMDNFHSEYTKTIHEDYVTIEHELIKVPNKFVEFSSKNLSQKFKIESKDTYFKIISNSCRVESKDNSSKKKCEAMTNIEYGSITLTYNYIISKGDKLIINYKYNYKEKYKAILFLSEIIEIPVFKNTDFCDYKLIISNDYINLGLKNNSLKKESDTVYSYYGECNNIIDEIRYSPKQSLLEADMEIFVENNEKFYGYVNFSFPRYYIGGKLDISEYKLTSFDNKSYIPENYIFENKYNCISIPATDKDKVGLNLHTSFYNKLNNDFKVDLPEKFYDIDLSKIDQEIIDKTNEIIREDSDKPDYYKIGKFVNSYINYDSSMFGKDLTLKQIFELKRGVCEHITKLYNAMLNAIGIKTLYISGAALQGNKTFGNIDEFAHAWTAAFINEKWVELDATMSLFEGIPASHIFKNFGEDNYNALYISNGGETKFVNNHFIKMIDVNSKNIFKEEKIKIIGIIIGICLIVYIFFIIYRKNNNSRLYSKFIEDKIDNSENTQKK